MKKYNTPYLELLFPLSKDIVTTSGGMLGVVDSHAGEEWDWEVHVQNKNS